MPDAPDAKVWLLTAGSYSNYHPVGAFATEAAALAVQTVLEDASTGYEDFGVISVPVLSAVSATVAWESLTLSFAIHWNGRIRYDQADQAPIRHIRLTGLPTDDDYSLGEETPPPKCEVVVRSFEQDYTLGVCLTVDGTDLERVAKVYGEQRAHLVAEPAIQTVRAWAASSALARGKGQHKIPSWVWTRTENAGLIPALQQAGIQ